MDIISFFCLFIVYGVLSVLILLVLLSIGIIVITNPFPIVEEYKEEESYKDPKNGELLKFPSVKDPYSLNLSVIVPAYNEEERLPPMLDEALEHLENRLKCNPNYKYEIIVVSDGSKDKTVEVAGSYAAKYGSEKVRCLELVKNRGKGGAVRLGVQRARGAVILFADADGATKFEDLTKLELALKELVQADVNTQPGLAGDSLAIVIGSRAHLEKESLATRSIFRNILMFGFHFLVWLFTVRGIRDTQCGFKLFTRRAANICFCSLHVNRWPLVWLFTMRCFRDTQCGFKLFTRLEADICFGSLHINRWAFDVELLYIAQKLNIPIAEIPVRWTEIEGSKVTPIISWIQMGCDLGLIWLKYQLGAWKIRTEKNE